MRQTVRRFLKDDSGATAIEYALIVTLISLGIYAGIGQTANSLEYLWGNNNSKIQQGLNQNN